MDLGHVVGKRSLGLSSGWTWSLQYILAWGPAYAASGQRLVSSLCQRKGLVTTPVLLTHPWDGALAVGAGLLWGHLWPLLSPIAVQHCSHSSLTATTSPQKRATLCCSSPVKTGICCTVKSTWGVWAPVTWHLLVLGLCRGNKIQLFVHAF